MNKLTKVLQDSRPEEKRRVVCAANRLELPDGRRVVVMSVRHCDHTYVATAENIMTRAQLSLQRPEQGFVDNYGAWLTRAEAWVVAEAANQILFEAPWNTKDGVKILYSENLY